MLSLRLLRLAGDGGGQDMLEEVGVDISRPVSPAPSGCMKRIKHVFDRVDMLHTVDEQSAVHATSRSVPDAPILALFASCILLMQYGCEWGTTGSVASRPLNLACQIALWALFLVSVGRWRQWTCLGAFDCNRDSIHAHAVGARHPHFKFVLITWLLISVVSLVQAFDAEYTAPCT